MATVPGESTSVTASAWRSVSTALEKPSKAAMGSPEDSIIAVRIPLVPQESCSSEGSHVDEEEAL